MIRTREPVGVIRPARSDITKGLQRLILPGLARIDAFGAPIAFQSATAVKRDSFGPYYEFSGPGSEQVSLSSGIGGATSASLLLVQQCTDIASNNGWHCCDTSSSGNHFLYGGLFYTSALATSRWASGLTAPSGKAFTDLVSLLITMDSAGNGAIYWNGLLWASASGITCSPNATLQFGLDATSGLTWRGRLYAAATWNRALTAVEAGALCRVPRLDTWQLFAPQRRLWVQLGAASGTGTTGVGSSTGTSTVTAAGQSLAETIGSIAGVSTALAVGQSLWDALGQSTGTSTVSGEGLTDSSSIGSSTGESTVLGVSSSLWETIGASTGTTLVTAVGQSLFEAIGEATGTSTVLGVDGSILISGAATGLSDGTSTVGGVGSSLWSASGSSSGIATVAGLLEAFFEATGSSVGTSTVAGVGSTPSTGTGTLDQATIDAIATAVWAQILDAGLSAEGLLRIIAAHAAGSATGLENGSPVFKSLDGTKDRITGTYAAGTRTVTGRDAT